MIYYSISAYWGWISLRESVWLPWYIGGYIDGSLDLALKDYPFVPQTGAGGANCYILFNFGYHINDSIDHMLYSRDERDFMKIVLR